MGIAAHEGEAILSVGLDVGETPETILGLATARRPAQSGSSLRFNTRPASATESAGLALTRFARLLPAVVSVEVDRGSPLLVRWIEDGTVLDVSNEDA